MYLNEDFDKFYRSGWEDGKVKKEIIKTSAQHRDEQAKLNEEKICPECGTAALLLGRGPEKSKNVNYYICLSCGCEYKVQED